MTKKLTTPHGSVVTVSHGRRDSQTFVYQQKHGKFKSGFDLSCKMVCFWLLIAVLWSVLMFYVLPEKVLPEDFVDEQWHWLGIFLFIMVPVVLICCCCFFCQCYYKRQQQKQKEKDEIQPINIIVTSTVPTAPTVTSTPAAGTPAATAENSVTDNNCLEDVPLHE